MLKTLLPAFAFVFMAGAVAQAENPNPNPTGYEQVWSDDFTKLSLRTGGPTYFGLEQGSGTWSSPGASWSSDPRGLDGDGGYDWYVNPSYYGWPAGYPALGQFAITPDGLRIRSEAPTPQMAAVLPHNTRTDVITAKSGKGDPTSRANFPSWMSGRLASFHAVRITPPFYFEANAKMPKGVGNPFSAIWLLTEKRPWPDSGGKSYEIDVHEGFGDSDYLRSTIHIDDPFNPKNTRPVVGRPSGVDLSAGFNTWGCWVTKDRQIFYFNGVEVGRIDTAKNANADQPYGIILDVSAGLPWIKDGKPSNGPHDMIVRYVRLYAPDTRGLVLKSPGK
jgi:hypothetical protein